MQNSQVMVDSYSHDIEFAQEVINDRVHDTEFKASSEQVILWTKKFTELARIEEIFSPMKLNVNSVESSKVVGKMWYEFSKFMPKYLCRTASKVESNEVQHYIVQVAFEELGSRKVSNLHCELFKKSIEDIGVDINSIDKNTLDLSCLNELWETLENTNNQSFILGINLGLEIPANENIECLFQSCLFDTNKEEDLAKSRFFIAHRINEDEHIRMNVANFLRFCPTQTDKDSFIEGFKVAVKFWEKFWSKAALSINQLREKKCKN